MNMKQRQAQLKKDRQLSRDKRNNLRKSTRVTLTDSLKDDSVHIIPIISETEHMERVLLEKRKLNEQNTILTLPVLTSEMLKDFATLIDGEIEYDYLSSIELNLGITGTSIESIAGTRIIVLRGVQKLQNSSLVEVSVRPYDFSDYGYWDTAASTSLDGYKIFGPSHLKKYFVLFRDPKNVYVYQKTIAMLGIYKAQSGKIPEDVFLETALGASWYTGVEYARSKEKNERKTLVLNQYGIQSDRALPKHK